MLRLPTAEGGQKVAKRGGDLMAVGDSNNPGKGSPSKPSSGSYRCWSVVRRDCARNTCQQPGTQCTEGSGCINMQVGVVSPPTTFDDEAAPGARRAVFSRSYTRANTRHFARLLILRSWHFSPLSVCLAMGASHSSLACETVLVMLCPVSTRGPVLPIRTA